MKPRMSNCAGTGVGCNNGAGPGIPRPPLILAACAEPATMMELGPIVRRASAAAVPHSGRLILLRDSLNGLRVGLCGMFLIYVSWLAPKKEICSSLNPP